MIGSLLLFTLFIIIEAASAIDRYYHLVVESVISNAHSPDCQDLASDFRYLLLVRDELNPAAIEPSMPGPKIEADEGDILHIQVTNLNQFLGITIHWHGIHQVGTPFLDGTLGISQCAIQPWESQNYSFVADPPGTHFWHGHAGMDVADGITGPIIVHPKNGYPFQYDEDVVVVFQDFYTQTGSQQQVGLHSFPLVWIGEGNSLLVGGRGIAPMCVSTDSNSTPPGCIENCANDPLSQLMTIKVETGKVYFLRFIQSNCLQMLNVAIAGHNLTGVQVSGTDVEPIENIQNFNIGSGQRYGLLLNASQSPGSYWLEATVTQRNAPELAGLAIIQYADADEYLPTEKPFHPSPQSHPEFWVYGETKNASAYEAYRALTTPQNEIKRYILVPTECNIVGKDGKQTGLGWAVNNISYSVTSPEPLLEVAVRAAKENGWPTEIPGTINMPLNPPTVWDYTLPTGSPGVPGPNVGAVGTSVIRLNKNDVLEIIFQNTYDLSNVSDVHQWHLHGDSFWIVGQGSGIFNPETDPATYNLVNPVYTDTLSQFPLGWTAVRVLFDNPGVWLFHCHILAHMQMGMAFAVVVQPDEVVPYPEPYCKFSHSMASSPDSAGPIISISVALWLSTCIALFFFRM